MSDPGPRSWMPAAEAARRLGVTRTTLYAYVSRGFVRSQASARSTRERLYASEDVERLRRRTEARRAPDKAAAHALEWGMPILESSIALIDGRHLYYRGVDVTELARTRSLEDVAALIWTGGAGAIGGDRSPPLARRTLAASSALTFVGRAQSALAAAAAGDATAMDLRPAAVVRTGLRILRTVVAAATGADPGDTGADAALAHAWDVGDKGREIIRAALVLCADHELNVSSFTARCVASAGSHPYDVVIAGLAALAGPKHGGASARAESMLASLRRTRPLGDAIAQRLRRGESIDGFGHPLYRDGDPRARLLLDLLADRYGASAEYRYVRAFADAAARATGEQPNVDFALGAVARVLTLPAASPLVLFATGRTVGWIGHAIEQYATGQLIRPRAKYVGVAPVRQPEAVGR